MQEELIVGHFPKDEAVRLAMFLQGAGISCRVDLDREFSRLHSRATSVKPALRRSSAFSDVPSGYVVCIPPEQGDSALLELRRSRWAYALEEYEEPDFDTAGEDDRILRTPRESGTPLWVVVVLALLGLAILLTRL